MGQLDSLHLFVAGSYVTHETKHFIYFYLGEILQLAHLYFVTDAATHDLPPLQVKLQFSCSSLVEVHPTGDAVQIGMT